MPARGRWQSQSQPPALIGSLRMIDESRVRLESANRAILHLFVVK